MQLTEEQIKELKKYSLVLNALNLEDGVKWGYVDSDDGWEELDGPYYNSKYVGELNFLPKKIEELFEEIKDNFDEDNFYNYDIGNYYGELYFNIVANKKELVVNYTNYGMNTEETSFTKTFQELADQPNPWYNQNAEKPGTKLLDPEYVNELKSKYGDEIELTYEGGGDNGWVNDQMETSNGVFNVNSEIEDMTYRIIDLFHGGWENNEGSNGIITFQLTDGTITLTHYMNYEQENDNHYMTLNF
jgi:hypothetical protein